MTVKFVNPLNFRIKKEEKSMRTKTFLFLVFALSLSVQISAQTNQPAPPPEQTGPSFSSVDNISTQLTKVSTSLQVFNKNFKAFLEKLPQGLTFNEKQQNLLLAFEILNRAEQRLEILQKFQIELTEKQADLKNRLTQVEQDMTPQGIERSVTFLGTTNTEEVRDSRRKTMEAERNNLRSLISQVGQNLADTSNEVREAATFVKRLRDKILPQIEREVSDLQ